MKKRVILDTDIGTDIDDAIALAYMYTHSNLCEIVGIATVGGNTKLRADIAHTVLTTLSASDNQLPDIKQGFTHSFRGVRGYFSGVEATNYTLKEMPSDQKSENAKTQTITQWYKDKLTSSTKPSEILAIGALTNIAKTITQFPSTLKYISNIYFMGGICTQNKSVVPNTLSHNVSEDPTAAKIVFDSGIPLTILTKDIPLQHSYTLPEFKKSLLNQSPIESLLYAHAREMITHSKRNSITLYDPILAMVMLEPELAAYTQYGHISEITQIHFNPKEKFSELVAKMSVTQTSYEPWRNAEK